MIFNTAGYSRCTEKARASKCFVRDGDVGAAPVQVRAWGANSFAILELLLSVGSRAHDPCVAAKLAAVFAVGLMSWRALLPEVYLPNQI